MTIAGQPFDAVEADALRLLDRAAEETAADVAAALVRGHDSLGDQEADGAPVVGEHAMGAHGDLAVAIGDAGLLLDPVHDQREAVGVEDGVDALQHAHRPLEPEPGVDVLRRERLDLVAGPQVVLHEDEVVDLHVAVAVTRAARRIAAGVGLAAVVEDLRALAARAGLGRLPEVVLAEPHDALRRDADPLPGGDRDRVLVEPRAADRPRGRSPRAGPARAPSRS